MWVVGFVPNVGIGGDCLFGVDLVFGVGCGFGCCLLWVLGRGWVVVGLLGGGIVGVVLVGFGCWCGFVGVVGLLSCCVCCWVFCFWCCVLLVFLVGLGLFLSFFYSTIISNKL